METSKSVLKRLVEVERQLHGDWENDEDLERKVGMSVFSSETVELGVELQKMDHASKKAKVFGEYLERTFLTEEKKEKRSSIERKGLNLNEVTECVKEVQTRLKKSFLYEVNFLSKTQSMKIPIGICLEAPNSFVCFLVFDDVMKEGFPWLKKVNFVGTDEKEEERAHHKRSKHFYFRKLSLEGQAQLEMMKLSAMKEVLPKIIVWVESFMNVSPCYVCKKYLQFDFIEGSHILPTKKDSQGSSHDICKKK